MTLDKTLNRNTRVLLVPGPDGYAAFNADTHQLYRLNASAALIVELFDGSRTIGDVCTELQPTLGRSGIDAAKQWIEYAVTEGLLTQPGESDEPPSVSEALERAQKLRDEGLILAAYACQYHASTLAPKDPRVWKALGELAHILGRREDAKHAYETYLSLDPDDAEIGHILLALRDEPPPLRASDRSILHLYSRFADYYDESMCEDLDYMAPSLLASAVGGILGARDSLEVVDLGCGTGLIAEHLRPLARRLTGVDLSPEMIARARKRGAYDRLHVGEITSWLGRASEPTFDLIVACDTLIYFGDLSQVVAPAASRLAPNGTLAFTVEKGEHDEPFRLTDSGRYSHTLDHVASVGQDAGLRLVKLENEVLRYEYGDPVEGLLAVLQRS